MSRDFGAIWFAYLGLLTPVKCINAIVRIAANRCIFNSPEVRQVVHVENAIIQHPTDVFLASEFYERSGFVHFEQITTAITGTED